MSRDNLLYAQFYVAFDESALLQFVYGLIALSEQERRGHGAFLGEGFHFQSFSVSTASLPLVVNIAKSSFLRQGDVGLNRWKRAIEIAKAQEETTLIPPMEILSGDDYLAIVMPKGQLVPKSQGREIDQLLINTAKDLRRSGLVLDDYPQVRQAFGIPFIIDWSDLNFVT